MTVGCSDSFDETGQMSEQTPLLSLDGSSGYFTLDNAEGQAWTVTDCPAWITPVAMQGDATDSLKFYIESNTRTPLRQGNIVVRYANSRAVTTRADQTNIPVSRDLRRSYGVGWGFDVRTYNDSRGLRDQIFSLEKLDERHRGMYRNEIATAIDATFYYGDDASDLQSDINAKLNLEGKFGMFSLDLKANFGMSAVNNSKRIFSWMRDYTSERLVYLNSPDFTDMQKTLPFTADFMAIRDSVTKYAFSKESDKYVRTLIDYYGTHFVTRANLGGCIDYYYSSVYDNSEGTIDVEAALKMEYANKFKLEGDAKYKDQVKQMDNETIEKVEVKGGNAIDYTSAIINGDAKDPEKGCAAAWKTSLSDEGKWELIDFNITPIYELFPDGLEELPNGEWIQHPEKDVRSVIRNYLDRLYYIQTPVTRTPWNE